MSDELDMQSLAETANYSAWVSDEPDGEAQFHLELGMVTLHFFKEEWDELLDLVKAAGAEAKKRRR